MITMLELLIIWIPCLILVNFILSHLLLKLLVTHSLFLDHISSNTNDKFIESGLVYSSISDHYPVFCIKNVKTVKSPFQAKYKRKINEKTIAIFKDNLNNIDWSSANNPSIAFNTLENTLSECFRKSFPLAKAKLSKQ